MSCSNCHEELREGDQFCEACGTPVDPDSGSAVPSVDPRPVDGRPSTVPPARGEPPLAPVGANGEDRCASCGETFDADGFCQNCGRRRPETRDHQETDMMVAAAVTDRGLRHRSNEDAYALVAAGDRVAAVVCDGVSTSSNAAQVSIVAAQAALAVLKGDLDTPERWEESAKEAIAAAQQAAAAVENDPASQYPSAPATTIVLALAGPGRAVVANVGDSRAYVVHGDGRVEMVSTDDSLVAAAILAGATPEVAYQAPGAHQITAWLGRDASAVTPHLSEMALGRDATLILCSDGVWQYAEAPADLFAAAAPFAGEPPLEVARRLVEFGLDAGGSDNLTATVVSLHRSTTATVVGEEANPDAHI